MEYKVFALLLVLVAHSTLAFEFMILDRDTDTSKTRACHHDHTVSCVKTQIDFELLASTETLTFPDGVEMTLKYEFKTRPGFVTRYYEGKSEVDTATLTFSKDHLTGSARYNDNVYVIEPCGHDCHVWYEENKEKFVDEMKNDEVRDDKPEFKVDEKAIERNSELLRMGQENTETDTDISIMVYYTTDAKNQYGIAAITSMVDNMIGNINVGFSTSNVPIHLNLHCLEELVGFVEGSSNLIYDFRDHYGANSHVALRNSADIALLLAIGNGVPGIAGQAFLAYEPSWAPNTIRLTPVGWVRADYAQTSFTPGHEIAHMFGCLHNDQNNQVTNPLTPYGYGNWFTPGSRTILAYYNQNYANRVNRYSSPSVFYNGVATGSATKDNARVLTEVRFLMAAEGDESLTCETSTSTTTSTTSTTTTTTTSSPVS